MESFRKEYDIIQRQWNGNLQTADQAFREFEQKVAGRPLVLFGAAGLEILYMNDWSPEE